MRRGSAELENYRVTGHAERQADGSIAGWCWSPDRPGEQLTVEILFDGRVIATVAADEFRRDLARSGRGDGCHAFKIDGVDDGRSGDSWLLTVREQKTLRIFAQKRLRRPDPEPDPTLDRLEAETGALRAELANRSPPQTSAALRASFAGAAARLFAASDGAAAAGERAMRRVLDRYPPLRFGIPAHPTVTLLIWIESVRTTAGIIRDWLPTLANGDAELIIADAGIDPVAPMLPTKLTGASFLSPTKSRRLSDAIAEAAVAARGSLLVLLIADAGDSDLTRSFDPSLATPDVRSRVLAGPPVTATAMRMQSVLAPLVNGPPHRVDADRVLCAFSPNMISALGGFDPGMDGSPVLAALDFCLKARMAGVRPTWCLGRNTIGIGRLEAAGEDHRAAFGQRWKLRGGEG